MKAAAVVCNIVVFLIVCAVLVTEGIPKQTVHIVFTVLSALIPIFSAAVILRNGTSAPERSAVRLIAVICNVVLLGLVCWSAVSQYPYPEGNGMIVFALLMIVAPILSLVAILHKSAERQIVDPQKSLQ